ncbi:uncharacterized protein LOC135205189 [Macrobrachium nipponense]|uniref:uncharacterized protein LOC135205189 n=1 Tax=Macrobrachium nipponense TaxID=159736 RepID=UPI0030C7BECF
MPMCLLCMTSLSNESMRPSKLKKHLETAHKDKKDKPLDFFKKLRDEFQGRMTSESYVYPKSGKSFLDVDEICQEMLFALKLTTDTKGESIFKKLLEVYFEENNIPLKNIVACATDGAAAMIGRETQAVLVEPWKTRVCTVSFLSSYIHDLLDDDLAVYVDHLKQLHNDMDTRFSDLLQMTVPHWFVDPFIADVSEVDVTLLESLIELQNNTTAQARFKRGGHQKLWMNQDVYKKYPILWKRCEGCSYLPFPRLTWLEMVFQSGDVLLSKTRNRLDIEKRGDLRLSLIAFKPNIDKLAALHQSQGSH